MAITLPTLAKFQLVWRTYAMLCCSLLPRPTHPHGRLCTTPVVSVRRKYKVHLNIVKLSKWTLYVSLYW